MASILLPLLVFVLGAAVVFGLYFLAVRMPAVLARRRLDQRIREMRREMAGPEMEGSTVIKGLAEGPLPSVDRLLGGTPSGLALSRWVEQSGVKISLSAVLLGSAAAAGLLFVVTAMLTPIVWIRLGAGLVGLVIPFLILYQRRRARLYRFEEHFPEALDLIGRAMRAGHGFTAGLKMVADEGEEPVAPEFRKTFDEQNFGLPLNDALNNLAYRVPLLDVKFFATAVLIQRDTGGNLAEILENLAHVVRERFKIQRQVRVHTAHGRLTGYVLLGLPAALAVALMFINPDHMNLLFQTSMGQTMVVGAIVMQVLGFLWIKQIVKIEV
jgi:tight adherence protein B